MANRSTAQPLALPDAAPATGAAVPPAGTGTADLNWLRMLFRSCRAKARLDLFRACAMLATDPDSSAQAYADALLRALSAGSARALTLHRPGATEMSFDERWLVSLIDAVRRGDDHSRDFLLRSRLPHSDRRRIGWLVTRLVAARPAAAPILRRAVC